MKKLANLFLTACMVLTLAACADGYTLNKPEAATPSAPFEGKIAIISNANDGTIIENNSARMMVKKYGEDKVIHVTWPANFMQEKEQMIKTVTKLGADPDIKAIIANPALPGTAEAFNKLQETRDDIFAIFIEPQGYIEYTAKRADILLATDELDMGPAMARQAQKLGAKTFVHYSFPRDMYWKLLGARRDLISKTCAELGMKFVDVAAIDPTSDVGLAGAQQFILDDVPKMVAKYGADTAFFATACIIQASLIEAVIETGAIYPQPCCPFPDHGLATVLYPDYYYGDEENRPPIKDVIAKERAALAEKNMLGRVSTWPERSSDLLTAASAEYAIKWINDEVPKEGVDVDVLKQLMEDYAGVEVFLTPCKDEYPYTEDGTGETYDNFLLMRMDYITF